MITRKELTSAWDKARQGLSIPNVQKKVNIVCHTQQVDLQPYRRMATNTWPKWSTWRNKSIWAWDWLIRWWSVAASWSPQTQERSLWPQWFAGLSAMALQRWGMWTLPGCTMSVSATSASMGGSQLWPLRTLLGRAKEFSSWILISATWNNSILCLLYMQWFVI